MQDESRAVWRTARVREWAKARRSSSRGIWRSLRRVMAMLSNGPSPNIPKPVCCSGMFGATPATFCIEQWRISEGRQGIMVVCFQPSRGYVPILFSSSDSRCGGLWIRVSSLWYAKTSTLCSLLHPFGFGRWTLCFLPTHYWTLWPKPTTALPGIALDSFRIRRP